MTREEFDVLIRRLEEASRRQPRFYLARIAGLAALACGYLALILVGSLALCIAIVAMVEDLTGLGIANWPGGA